MVRASFLIQPKSAKAIAPTMRVSPKANSGYFSQAEKSVGRAEAEGLGGVAIT